MSFSRRKFMQWAASVSTLAVAAPGYSKAIPLFDQGLGALDPGAAPAIGAIAGHGYQPEMMPSQTEVWDWLTWMAKLGPKFTGNAAHRTYVDFLEKQFKALGINVTRDNLKFPRWEARRTGLTVTPKGSPSFKAAVTSSFPYSGQTSAEGVTGDIVYAGVTPQLNLAGLEGKIVLVDCPVPPRAWWHWYSPIWGLVPSDMVYPAAVRPTRGPVTDLTQFKKAGAIGVILVWTDVSDANAADQYSPFSRPHQEIPALYVGRETGAKLRGAVLSHGAKATLVLEADNVADSPTDHLIAPLPGTSSDEIIIINTHTDGTNATEENGGVALLALAKYFSQIPQSQRKRTLMFVLASGHMCLPYVPSISDVIKRHPDFVTRAVGAVTIEHLGCHEWVDDVSLTNFHATGQNEIGIAYAPIESNGKIVLDAFQNSGTRTAVVNPVDGITGEGGVLQKAGIPNVGYICMPEYLLASPANGCIEKLSGDLMHRQIEVFAKIIHKMDTMTAAELKGA